MKLLEVLTESENDRLLKRAFIIYKALKHGRVLTLNNHAKPVKIKYVLPDEDKIMDIRLNDKFGLPLISIHTINVKFYDENDNELDTSDGSFFRKYPYVIDDYVRNCTSRFKVFNVRIIFY